MKDLSGKVAIVTGAANGSGRAIAQRLARDGAAVVGVDIDEPALRDTIDGINRDGGTATSAVADVADIEATRAFVELAVSQYGGLDILVNNAAAVDREFLARDTNVVDIDVDVWERAIAVNLTGPMLACKFAIPHLIEREGNIVNVTTIGALRGRWNQVAYGVSKAGLNALTEYVATTYGRDNIRCNAVAPGLFLTAAAERNLSPRDLQNFASDRLIARTGRPEDIAGVVRFLVSEDAAYITGQVIVVDGGTINHVPGYATYAPRARIDVAQE